MSKTINPNIQKLIVPVISFAVLMLLFIVSFRIGLTKIQDQNSQNAKLQKDIETLKLKEETLSKISNLISGKGQVFSLALPSANSTLIVFTQIKSVAGSSGLILQNLKAGSETKDQGYSKTEIGFDLNGTLPLLLAFFKNIPNLAPVMTLSKIQINSTGTEATANVGITVYWSPLPLKIPAITDPISDLTKDETAVLDKISKLTLPPFSTVPASGPTGRTNPF